MTILGRCLPLALVVAMAAPAAAQGEAGGPSGSASDLLISRQLAEAFTLSTGDIVRLSPDSSGEDARPFRVGGIYEPTPDPIALNAAKHEARLHLTDLLALTADPEDPMAAETVDRINIALTDPGDAHAFARDLEARVPGIAATPLESSRGDVMFRVIERFHLAIALVTVFASTVCLLALSVMLVDERRETVGILRLIGLSSRRVLVQVLIEGFLVATVGAGFGLLLALGSERLINAYFQWHYDTALVFVRISPKVWLQCMAIAVPLGAGASVAASWTLLRRGVLTLARR